MAAAVAMAAAAEAAEAASEESTACQATATAAPEPHYTTICCRRWAWVKPVLDLDSFCFPGQHAYTYYDNVLLPSHMNLYEIDPGNALVQEALIPHFNRGIETNNYRRTLYVNPDTCKKKPY